MAKLTHRLICIAVVLLFCGCGKAIRSYESELNQSLDLAKIGDLQGAIELHDRFNRKNRDILYLFELGEFLRLQGKFPESISVWREAEKLIEDWETRARSDPNLLLQDLGSVLVNDKVRVYQGHDFEKVMLTTRIAMSYLAVGDLRNARVAIKRAHEREAVIATFRERQYERIGAENSDDASIKNINDLPGYPVATLDDPQVTQLKNSYQSAFSHYLAGFIYEVLGERGLAAPGYRQAIELQPSIDLGRHALASLDRNLDNPDESKTDLLVVFEDGLSPAKSTIRLDVPINTDEGFVLLPLSFPAFNSAAEGNDITSFDLTGASIELKNQNVDVMTNIDLFSRRALRDDFPFILLRAITRGSLKATLQSALNKQDKTGISAELARIGGLVTEEADERIWRSLPKRISLARTAIEHGDYEMFIQSQYGSKKIKMKVDGRYAILFVRSLGSSFFSHFTVLE